jgi:hypothetical protein
MSQAPFTVEPYPGRDGRTGAKIQVRMPAAGNPMRRAPEVEGYECYFVSYFGHDREIVFSYRRKEEGA